MATSNKDQFANYAIVTVAESAANTLTFKKLETGISLIEKVAWVLNRIEYTINNLSAAVFNGDGDSVDYGLSVGSGFTAPANTEVTIIDYNKVVRRDYGAAASMRLDIIPIIKDFSALPGGGIIVPPAPIYLYAMGTGLTGATAVVARMYYTLLPLSVDQYWELVEARRVLSS